MNLTLEQKQLLATIKDYKSGILYYSEEIANNPNSDYVQQEFSRRKENLEKLLQEAKEKYRQLNPIKEYRFVYEFGFGDWHPQTECTVEKIQQMSKNLQLFSVKFYLEFRG